MPARFVSNVFGQKLESIVLARADIVSVLGPTNQDFAHVPSTGAGKFGYWPNVQGSKDRSVIVSPVNEYADSTSTSVCGLPVFPNVSESYDSDTATDYDDASDHEQHVAVSSQQQTEIKTLMPRASSCGSVMGSEGRRYPR